MKIHYTGLRKKESVLHAKKRIKANWVGHILRRNCLLKYVMKKRKDIGDGKARKEM